MKNLLFSLIAVVFSFSSSFSNSLENFPKYSSVLYMEDACSCSGMFSSCSGSGNCSCTCGYFSCSCTANEKITSIAINISISEEQYKNIEKLASKLSELKLNNAVTYLANSIEHLKNKDAENFEINRVSFLKELSQTNKRKKEKINQFFASIGAEERV